MNDPRTNNGRSPSDFSAAPLVHWINVVIPAQFHNPSILNRDFLGKKIVPRDWDVVEAISTPAAAQIVYANGVRFVADQSRLEIRREINGPMRSEYDIFSMATRYVKTLPYVPYKTVGYNWQLSLECPDPDPWLFKRFYLPSVYADGRALGCGVQLRYAASSSVCSLTLNPGMISKPDTPQIKVILVNANFHHEASTPSRIITALKKWPENQDLLNKLIDKLFQE